MPGSWRIWQLSCVIDGKYKPKRVCLVCYPNFRPETGAPVSSLRHCDLDLLRPRSLLRTVPNLIMKKMRNQIVSIIKHFEKEKKNVRKNFKHLKSMKNFKNIKNQN